MCGVCGCEQAAATRLVTIEQNLLEKNNNFAEQNRRYFAVRQMQAFNLVSSPGSGKTSLLVRTLTDLRNTFSFAVIEGDQQTDLDAARIATTHVPVKQINTGKICHLDAHMVGHALEDLPSLDNGILFIENIGNLICPTLFDLGESARIALLSVTEGEDKPLKYPYIFASADLVIINKIDLLPHVDFNLDRCMQYAYDLNPKQEFIKTSVKRKDGLKEWYDWLSNKAKVYQPHATLTGSN